jgi:DNA-binding SARP family transcriptional activator/tetratricopeptide (TPR) repeat protein
MVDIAPDERTDLPDRVEIRVLGDFTVSVCGVEVPPERWPSLRAAQLVQLLSLAEGHRLLREQVIDALWPQLDPEAGAANLRKAAHHARQALSSRDAVVLQGGQVVLCPSKTVAIDATRFERLADAALARRDPTACAEAASAYGGELLPGSRYEEWTEGARTRLRARYLDLLRVSGQWEQLAETEPTDEPAHRELIRRELAAGNRAAAIRWYSRLRGALQQMLGVSPDRETEALYDRCVAGLRRSGPAFVGRHMELAQVAAWLRALPGDRPGGLIVRGPAGIGKSAFSQELAALARRRGLKVVSVDAVQSSRPYGVIAAAIEQLIRDDRPVLDKVGDPARSVLAALSPLAGPSAALQGPLGRHQVIGAFRRALLAASDGGAVIVHIDDAHQIDEADADVLLHLVVTGRPVFVVLALRPPATESNLARGVSRLASGGHLTVIDLGPLPDDEAADLVEKSALQPMAAPIVERIVRVAQGNPFAALELARCAEPAGGDARMPANVREAITARLCDVDASAMSLLKCLALAGDEFDTAMAVALSEGTEGRAFALLDLALAAGVLVVSGARYRFRHELVRQALVEQIPPHQRLKVHRHAARRLAELNAPPAMIASHWLAGGSRVEAAPWLVTAASDAVRLGAFRDALRYLEPVLEHDRDHADALRLRAEALDALGEPGAVAAYLAAAKAAGESGAPDLRVKAALAQIKLGDPRGGLRLLEGVQPTTVEGRLCEALAYSGAAALGVADPAMGTQKAGEARRLALETGDTAAIVIASWAQAAAAHARGELHGSVWADLHETHHVPHLAVRVFDGQLCIMQRFLYGARPYPEVIAFADALAAEARRLGATRGHAFGVTLRGEAELLAGDLDAAEEDLTLGARLHHAIGAVTGEAFALQRLAEVELYRGRRDIARERLGEALDLARQTDVGFHLLDRIYGTRVTLGADAASAFSALEDAREAVRGPFETCPGCRITFAVPAAIAAARARRLDLAAEYERAVEYLANVVMRLPAWYAAHDEVRAHIALVSEDGEAVARTRFAAAARRFREAGQPLDAARCDELATGASRVT